MRSALFTTILALSFVSPAHACRTWIHADRLFHENAPAEAANGVLVLEVEFTDLNAYDTEWPNAATARARVVRVLHGSYQGGEIDIGVRVSTCDASPISMRGIIVGELGPWADGRIALIPVLADARD